VVLSSGVGLFISISSDLLFIFAYKLRDEKKRALRDEHGKYRFFLNHSITSFLWLSRKGWVVWEIILVHSAGNRKGGLIIWRTKRRIIQISRTSFTYSNENLKGVSTIIFLFYFFCPLF